MFTDRGGGQCEQPGPGERPGDQVLDPGAQIAQWTMTSPVACRIPRSRAGLAGQSLEREADVVQALFVGDTEAELHPTDTI